MSPIHVLNIYGPSRRKTLVLSGETSIPVPINAVSHFQATLEVPPPIGDPPEDGLYDFIKSFISL